MNSKISDTNPEFEKVYFEHLKKQSISDKFKQIDALTTFVRSLSKRAIARVNPGKSKQETDLLFVKYHYGEDAYNKIKKYLEDLQNNE